MKSLALVSIPDVFLHDVAVEEGRRQLLFEAAAVFERFELPQKQLLTVSRVRFI